MCHLKVNGCAQTKALRLPLSLRVRWLASNCQYMTLCVCVSWWLMKCGFHVLLCRARICKRLWSPEIDSKESIQPAYVAWWAGTTNRVVVPARQAGNRFLGSFKGLKIRAQFVCVQYKWSWFPLRTLLYYPIVNPHKPATPRNSNDDLLRTPLRLSLPLEIQYFSHNFTSQKAKSSPCINMYKSVVK